MPNITSSARTTPFFIFASIRSILNCRHRRHEITQHASRVSMNEMTFCPSLRTKCNRTSVYFKMQRYSRNWFVCIQQRPPGSLHQAAAFAEPRQISQTCAMSLPVFRVLHVVSQAEMPARHREKTQPQRDRFLLPSLFLSRLPPRSPSLLSLPRESLRFPSRLSTSLLSLRASPLRSPLNSRLLSPSSSVLGGVPMGQAAPRSASALAQ